MKKWLLSGCSGIFLFSFSTTVAQVLATAHTKPPVFHQQASQTIRLQDALLELQRIYRVDILFEEDMMQQIVVPAGLLDRNATLEKNLRNLLTPNGFRYKKLLKGGYVVRRGTASVEESSRPRASAQADMIRRPDAPASGDNEKHEEAEAAKVDRTITGRTIDEKGEGLPGVSIVIKGTTRGTTSDKDGRYTLQVPDGNPVLIFSFLGYQAQEVSLGNMTTVNVTLQADTKALDEVVVVGYGTQRRKDLTGAVGTIESKEIQEMSVTRIDQALLGKVAGVQVKPVSGEPGAAPQIRIRGIGSISAGAGPLYVVDGFPTQTIETLNPNDIESLDILKDASATAIYGSRGSNGVIIINTKRGKSGKANVTFDAYYGLQKVSKLPKFMTAREQAQYFYDGVKNRNIDGGFNVTGPATSWNFKMPQLIVDVLEGRNTTDVEPLDEVLRVAPQQQYQLSATGGTDAIKYAVSGEYFNQDGLIINSNFKRYSLRINLDAKLSNRLALKVNFNPSFIDKGNVNSSGVTVGAGDFSVMGAATSVNPFYPIYDQNGDYFWYNGLEAVGNFNNPAALAREVKDRQRRIGVLGNINAEYKLTDDLRFNVLIGATLLSSKGSRFVPQLPSLFNEPASGTDNAVATYNWLTEYTLNYTKSFGKHNLVGLAGFTAQQETGESNTLTSNKYPNNLVPTLSAVSGIITNGSSEQYQWSLISYLARVNYNYNSKYYVTASIRTDGSSRFGSDNKYGVFPSAALAWRLSDEPFLRDMRSVSELKLRASYGKTGNNNIGNFEQFATISYQKYPFGETPIAGFIPGRLSNPLLTWETQEQLNAGVDAAFFNNRIRFNIDYFISRNTNLLLNVNTPGITGFSTALKNIGEVKNTGWEFSIGTVNTTSRIKWTTDFNISTFKNEVVRLGPTGDPIISGGNITMIGQPIGMFYGWLTDGVFKNQAEVDRGPVFSPGTASRSRPGDLRFVDVSGANGKPDGVINSFDKTIMGSPYPDFYYGMTNRFSYKNLSLSVSLQGVVGNQLLSIARRSTFATRSRFRNAASQNNYWKSEQDPGDGNTPRPNDAPTGNVRGEYSQRWLDTGTYLRINNISLNYTVPDKLVQRAKLGSLRIYVNANNPFIFTKNQGFNPDVSNGDNPLTPGMDMNDYPLPKSLILGVSFGF
ncbi:SusC/RagA family TonB-linked outer membrane protein [Spirosoma panaciterrae]|uniref:SusC/RagA family TonB-linked outer membrane protein n=1 Tax=Spirosoma panaciterrae TaxID=496058 RepID=UPI0003696545|nr:TonB-dependent receptor [Spirosoma panaciterrae]